MDTNTSPPLAAANYRTVHSAYFALLKLNLQYCAKDSFFLLLILLATDQSMSRGILGSASVIVSQSNYLTNETANIFSRSNWEVPRDLRWCWDMNKSASVHLKLAVILFIVAPVTWCQPQICRQQPSFEPCPGSWTGLEWFYPRHMDKSTKSL